MKADAKNVGEAKDLSGREENKKEDNNVKKLHDVREVESEKRKKRWVGIRERMCTPTPPTCREMHNRHTRDLNEKRDKQAQSNNPRLPFFLVPPHNSLAS